jgi:hypothetical protein
MMTDHTAETINKEVPFHGSVARVFSTVVVAHQEAGVRTKTFTSAVPPTSDQTLTEGYGEDVEREADGEAYTTGPYWEITEYTSEEINAIREADKLDPDLAEHFKDLLED